MQTVRQAFTILKQNPLLSTISILGTAFAITMIMAIVITWQTKYADLEPEVNRSRCLYFSAMHVYDKEKDGNNNWSNPSAAFMKECVQPVPEVEYCTAFSPAGLSLASLTDGNNRVKVDAMRTDPDFWKVFSMQFLAGRGFSEADRAGESKAVVVCASVARKLYGSTDVVGQEFLLNRELARIVGVVKDVSVTAKDAYAQVWGMYSADELKITGVHSYLGGMQIAVLARTSDDFPAIREGIAKQVERVNAGLGNKQIDIMEQPDNIVAHVNHVWANVGPDLTMLYLQYAVALFIILLVPSLNLCGLSNSRMQQRITELGVRKAFGGTKSVLVRQSITNKSWGEGNSSNGPMGIKTALECFKSLKTPEAVTIYTCMVISTPVNLPGQPATGIDLLQTDDTFWRVFDFSFVAGKPYDQATFDAGLPVAVITESVARRLFQTTEAVGREFLLNHAPYTVSGVVKDVSTLANTAYAQVWVPYTSTEITKSTWSDEHMGMMSVTILAKSRDDFPAIREETERRRQEYDTVIGENGYSLIYRNRPYDQEKNAAGMAANIEPDVDQARRQRLIIFIILLIVPAINLSSMTQSRLRQRVAEIGVRRAFGSTRLELMGQIIAENLVVTLLAGVMGLLLSVAFAYLGNTLLFAQEFSQTLSPPAVDASILLHGSTFGWALLFCFVLNLLSSGIPAWRASRIGIVNALGGRLHK